MANYKMMYAILCGAMSEALDRLPRNKDTACACWQMEEAMAQAEELYLAADDDNLILLPPRA